MTCASQPFAASSAKSRTAGDHVGLHVPHHIVDAAARNTGAEELRGEIQNLVGLVENERIRGAENVAEPVFLQREICEQQVMVHHNDINLLSRAAGHNDVVSTEFSAAIRRGGCPW